MNKTNLIVFILVIMFFVPAVYAQSKKKKMRKESISFDDELIQGELRGADLLYLLRRKHFNYKKLIKLRQDFLPEMRRSAEGVQRGDR